MPKKRTVWPGQHVICGVCGRLYYWGGHGQKGRMMCSGARDYACWNAATFDGRDAARRLAATILTEAERLPEFDAAFRDRVRAAADVGRAGKADGLIRLDRELAQLDRELANLADAVAKLGLSPTLEEKLRAAEARKAGLAADRADLVGQPDDAPDLPPVAELKARARAAVGRLAFDDPAFGRVMSRLVPRVVVLPYRPRDGGKVVLRAVATVALAPLLGPGGEAAGGVLTREVAVDLFDPPQRVAYRERVAALRAGGATERAAARELGLPLPTVQKAMALHRRMAAAGSADPYEPVTGPPADAGKVRRHRHARYRFDPLPGFPAWPTTQAA